MKKKTVLFLLRADSDVKASSQGLIDEAIHIWEDVYVGDCLEGTNLVAKPAIILTQTGVIMNLFPTTEGTHLLYKEARAKEAGKRWNSLLIVALQGAIFDLGVSEHLASSLPTLWVKLKESLLSLTTGCLKFNLEKLTAGTELDNEEWATSRRDAVVALRAIDIMREVTSYPFSKAARAPFELWSFYDLRPSQADLPEDTDYTKLNEQDIILAVEFN